MSNLSAADKFKANFISLLNFCCECLEIYSRDPQSPTSCTAIDGFIKLVEITYVGDKLHQSVVNFAEHSRPYWDKISQREYDVLKNHFGDIITASDNEVVANVCQPIMAVLYDRRLSSEDLTYMWNLLDALVSNCREAA